MHQGEADLLENLGFRGADCLNILLIEDDVVGACGQIKDALPGEGNAMKYTQKESSLTGLRRGLVRGQILDQNGNVADSIAKLLRKRVERLFDNLHKVITIHGSRAKGELTPNSRHRRSSSLVVIILFVVLILFFFFFLFFFLFFFVVFWFLVLVFIWFVAQEEIGSCGVIEEVCVGILKVLAHAQMVRLVGRERAALGCGAVI